MMIHTPNADNAPPESPARPNAATLYRAARMVVVSADKTQIAMKAPLERLEEVLFVIIKARNVDRCTTQLLSLFSYQAKNLRERLTTKRIAQQNTSYASFQNHHSLE